MLTEFIDQQLRARAASGEAGEAGELPLNHLLYLAVKDAIQSGKLRPDTRLPSSRELACDLALARNTVINAFSRLEAEGFVESRHGSGTYVREQTGQRRLPRRKPVVAAAVNEAIPSGVSARGARLLKQAVANELEVQPFTHGVPDFSPFPIAQWQKLQSKHWRLSYAAMLDYNDTGGFTPLKRAIAQHLRLFRGMTLEADQVLVTTGTQQSIDLCVTLLSDAGDTAWVEDPLYWGAAQTFRANSLRLYGVATDEEGMNVDACLQAPPARLIYVTPSHQYPTGGVLSARRRHQLLQLAHEQQAWVLEDDYDSEFRFSAAPASPPLHVLDEHERVFYLGTFSKSLYPGIKLAYVVVPLRWVAAFRRAHYDLHRPGQMHQQAALAEFIEMGHFHATIRAARQHYAERRGALLQALQPCLGERARISGAEQGLHLCVHLPAQVDDVLLAQRAAQLGLSVRALSRYAVARSNLRGVVVGYGYAPLDLIAQDGRRLAQLIARTLQG